MWSCDLFYVLCDLYFVKLFVVFGSREMRWWDWLREVKFICVMFVYNKLKELNLVLNIYFNES